jgi:hypothetical protein
MLIDLLEIRPGAEIEYESEIGTHGTHSGHNKTRKGRVIQITDKVISVKGKLYPDSILINDLVSGQAKIIRLRGEDFEMAAKLVNWDEMWPLVMAGINAGMSSREIAEQLGIDNKILLSKLDREKKKGFIVPRKTEQTPPPDPGQVGSQGPNQESTGPAVDSIPETELPRADWLNRHLVEELQERWVTETMRQSLPKEVKLEIIKMLLDIEVA